MHQVVTSFKGAGVGETQHKLWVKCLHPPRLRGEAGARLALKVPAVPAKELPREHLQAEQLPPSNCFNLFIKDIVQSFNIYAEPWMRNQAPQRESRQAGSASPPAPLH